MIDIENEIFTDIAKRLRAEYTPIYVTGEYVNTPPSFPCVTIAEVSNQVYRNGRTSDNIENFVQVLYEVNVYSNKTSGRKSEAKGISNTIDKELAKLGFTRTMGSPTPNINDATIYRYTTRYRAIVDKNKVIYRR